MFRENSPQKQPNLMDHSLRVPESVREKKLYNDWPGYFFENIFSNINEERFAVLYSDKYSRPNTPVNVLVGLLILKELNSWIDEDLIGEFYFDYRVQFALGITDIGKEGLCENTISNFRSRLYDYAENYGRDLLKEEIEALTEALIEFTRMDTSLARQDSFMISSNCKEMGRLELIYTVNYNMVKTLSTEDTSLIPECCNHYLENKDKSTHIYKIKKEEVNGKTKQLLNESLALYEVIPQKLHDIQSFQNLARLLEEQVESLEDTVVPKDAKDITSDSLQNPSEPDATYRKKGKQQSSGYVMNTVEARDEKKKMSMIVHHDLQQNTVSDVELGQNALDSDLKGVSTLVSDGSYYSPETVKKACSEDIELSFSALNGRSVSEDRLGSDGFIFDNNKKIIKCPGGFKPLSSKYDEEKQVFTA